MRRMSSGQVGNETIDAHRLILASRSPVFERMFSCDWDLGLVFGAQCVEGSGGLGLRV